MARCKWLQFIVNGAKYEMTDELAVTLSQQASHVLAHRTVALLDNEDVLVGRVNSRLMFWPTEHLPYLTMKMFSLDDRKIDWPGRQIRKYKLPVDWITE